MSYHRGTAVVSVRECVAARILADDGYPVSVIGQMFGFKDTTLQSHVYGTCSYHAATGEEVSVRGDE